MTYEQRITYNCDIDGNPKEEYVVSRFKSPKNQGEMLVGEFTRRINCPPGKTPLLLKIISELEGD